MRDLRRRVERRLLCKGMWATQRNAGIFQCQTRMVNHLSMEGDERAAPTYFPAALVCPGLTTAKRLWASK